MRRGAESKNDRGGVVVLEGCGRQERRGGLSFSSKPVRQERSGGGGVVLWRARAVLKRGEKGQGRPGQRRAAGQGMAPGGGGGIVVV